MKLFFVFYKSFPKHQSVHQHSNISKTTVIRMYSDTSKRFHFMIINIDYLMVGLRYGFYPRVTDVISRTSEVRASE